METQPNLGQSEPTTPTKPQPPKRRPILMIIVVVGGLLCLICLGAAGLFGFTVVAPALSQTTVAENTTSTAVAAATGTQVAEVTGTAVSRAAATERAVALATSHAASTATQAANKTATANAVIALAPPLPSGWGLLQFDEFSVDTNTWYTGNNDSEFALDDSRIENGKYVWEVTSKKGFIGWRQTVERKLRDFYVSVDADLDNGYKDTQYGLLLRADSKSDQFYVFEISNIGWYYFELQSHNRWTQLRSGFSTALVRDGKNTIAVSAVGSEFTLFVNGKKVWTVTDATLTQGDIAATVSLPYGGLKARVLYDNFVLIGPP